MKVNLTYFKDTGKYYCEGLYHTNLDPLFEIWDEVREMKKVGALPGLVKGSTEFYVLVEVPEHEHNHPRLIL
jgi:hypothetical protein